MLIMETIIHSADISNQAMPWKMARQWAHLVCDEFEIQEQKEAKLGLPITAFMKNLHTTKARAKLQVGFITAIMLPWWSAVSRMRSLSSKMVQKRYSDLLANRDKYGAAVAFVVKTRSFYPTINYEMQLSFPFYSPMTAHVAFQQF